MGNQNDYASGLKNVIFSFMWQATRVKLTQVACYVPDTLLLPAGLSAVILPLFSAVYCTVPALYVGLLARKVPDFCPVSAPPARGVWCPLLLDSLHRQLSPPPAWGYQS